jgi:hypothetical protein
MNRLKRLIVEAHRRSVCRLGQTATIITVRMRGVNSVAG